MIRSLTVRALIAVAFLVGFYLVAGALGLGLLGGAVAIVAQGGSVPAKLLFIMVVAGGTVLWSLIPRWSKFEPPGPRITRNEHPKLFALIESIATTMGQSMPAEVYVMPDVNAFVAQVGGVLGFGGRRVMALGLGLLAADNVSQLRATIAHELGHYAGGDTKIGGLIYATRAAMVRSVQNLEGGWLQAPFVWALKLYLRLTNAISRHQELFADEWSVRIAGKTAHVTGLRAEAVHGAAFGLFLDKEVAPLVGRGVGPDNIFEGYRAFAKSPTWVELEPVLGKILASREHDPYDTHPALEERIAYAEALDLPDLPMETAPASTLLGGETAIEEQVSSRMLPDSVSRVSWTVAAEHFGEQASAAGRRLQARSPDLDLGTLLRALGDERAFVPIVERTSPVFVAANYPDLVADRRREAAVLVGGYLSALLHARGFAWRTMPGEPLALERDGVRLVPYQECLAVLEGSAALPDLEARVFATGLHPSEKLEVSAELAVGAAERRTSVHLEEGNGKTIVRAGFGHLAWPRCCALCCGSADEDVQLRLDLGEGRYAEIELGACRAHAPSITTALRGTGYDDGSDTITLEVKCEDYARLIEAVNA